MSIQHLRNKTIHCLTYCGIADWGAEQQGDSILEIAHLDTETIEVAVVLNSCSDCCSKYQNNNCFDWDKES